MSSTQEPDADAIRLKRLARLQSGPQQRPAAENSDTGVSSSSNSGGGGGGVDSSSTADPPLKRERDVSPNKRQRHDEPSAASPSPALKPLAVGMEAAPSAPLKPKLAKQEASQNGLSPAEMWEDKTLSQIFKVALQPGPRTSDYIVIEDVRKDLEESAEEGKAPFISTEILDQIILRVCGDPKIDPMDYIIGSWRRASTIQRTTPAAKLNEHKVHVLKEAKRLCVSYGVYGITIPDMFETSVVTASLGERLLCDSESDKGLPLEFLQEVVSRFDEEPELIEHFEMAIQGLSRQLSEMSMIDNYKPFILALNRFVQIKPLAFLLTNLPSFLPAPGTVPPHLLEKHSLLGPFFRLSPLQAPVAQTYFFGARTKTQTALNDANRALQISAQNLQDQLFQIVNTLIRVSTEARNKVLDFFAMIFNANKKRGALQVDSATVATDGFMLNIAAVLNRLCEPFMDASFSKIDKIDIDYLRRGPRIEIDDETKLNADEPTAQEFYSQKAEGSNNFISDLFFLNVASHHYGLGATENTHDALDRDISEMEKHLEKMQAERQNWVNTPQIGLWDRNIERMRQRIEEGTAYRHALEVLLFDKISQSRTLLFMRYLTSWLLRLVDPNHKYPQAVISLPLPENSPDQFNNLPEYFVEDIGLCFGFVCKYLPDIVVSTQVDELVVFCITFLRMSAYIRKPNLKSKLVEILYHGILPFRGKRSMLGDIINGHSFALKYLMHALMNFYIEIERQYYEKFTVRYHISEIIKSIWSNQVYRAKLEQESQQNVDFFVRFVALLLNDVTYVLDNALTALGEIHKLQYELEDSNQPLSPQERAEKEKSFAKAEREATSYMQLGNETVAMLKLFTSAISDAFVQPEIVHRLAGMLDYNLEALVGDKCNSLRVQNPEKYRFNPKALLSEITDVYLNLKSKTAFIEAIAKDGRSYSVKLFEKMLGILERSHLKGTPEIAAMQKLAAMVEETKRRMEEGEEELGEIPDDFLDPLMATLMEDPVILPSSKVTIDRQTIKVHLLSDPKDPFNREPLKLEDVTPNTELKEQIDAWIKEKRANKGAPVAMDIDG